MLPSRKTKTIIGQAPPTSGVDYTAGQPEGVVVYSNVPTIAMCHYFAAPLGETEYDGQPDNNGSFWNPWDLQTALDKIAELNGKTLGVKSGTYIGKFKSTLTNATILGISGTGSLNGNNGLDGPLPIIDGYTSTTLLDALPANLDPVTFEVADASLIESGYASGAITTLVIDGEAMQITGVSGNDVSVTRRAAGTSPEEAPVVAAHSEGAIVRTAGSPLWVAGANTVVKNLHLKITDPLRDWRYHGNEGIRGHGVAITAVAGTKIINCRMSNNLNGIFTGSSSSNTEVYGNLIFNNGMFDGTDQGKGHGMYLENGSGFSKIYDNISLNNFGHGAQMYGRTAPYVGGDARGNVFANNGSPIDAWHQNLLVGPETDPIPSVSIDSNYFLHPHTENAYNFKVGYGAGVTEATVTNSYFIGGEAIGMEIADVDTITANGNKHFSTHGSHVNISAREDATYSINNNTYYKTGTADDRFNNRTELENEIFSVWKSQTGYDANSSITAANLPQTVIIRPNAYEAGRAHIIVIAPTGNSVVIDLAQTGLPANHFYVIKNAFNIDGDAVVSGSYAGGSVNVTIPLTSAASLSVATPVGGNAIATTLPSFSVFVMYDGGTTV